MAPGQGADVDSEVVLMGVLAAVMVATRKVDWYSAMGRTEPKAGPGAAAVVAG